MSHKIFFDTNIIRNSEGPEYFLGGREQLERFKKVAEIMIPNIVITEIKNQRRKHFKAKRDSFFDNPFFKLMGLSQDRLSDEKIEKWIEQLEEKEKIEYTKVSVKDRDILPEIFELASNNLPPFEVDNDKGFKDALIYFTILQYVEENPTDQIYFICKDGRLGEAFKGNDSVRVFKDYEEYEKHQKDYFTDNYFIERLHQQLVEGHAYQEILNLPFLDPSCIKSIKLDKELNWVIEIEIEGLKFIVEVDYVSKEIISILDLNF
jgi:rRNA-processing protein FCF1